MIAIRFEWLGRGQAFAIAYPFGVLVQLFFAMIGAWAAREIAGAPRMGFSAILARLAALYTCYDAAATFAFTEPIGTVIIPAFAFVGLGLVLFRGSGSRAVWVILITFLIKVISLTMLHATAYTLL